MLLRTVCPGDVPASPPLVERRAMVDGVDERAGVCRFAVGIRINSGDHQRWCTFVAHSVAEEALSATARQRGTVDLLGVEGVEHHAMAGLERQQLVDLSARYRPDRNVIVEIQSARILWID